MSTTLEFTKDTFFKPSKIELINRDTNELITVNNNGSLEKLKKQPTPENKDTIVRQNTLCKREV